MKLCTVWKINQETGNKEKVQTFYSVKAAKEACVYYQSLNNQAKRITPEKTVSYKYEIINNWKEEMQNDSKAIESNKLR